jgi:WS/DGAT/MGAT family acyltransferase
LKQLSSLDAQFLALESSRQTGHVSGLAVLDPSTTPSGKLELADIEKLLTERLPLLPPLRRRLVDVPLGLDYPYWIDDPDFELDFHLRELALAPPPTDDKLADQVARVVARPLDRSRPLWELYLIHGLANGRVGMLTKIHHALIDGLSGAEIMAILFDVEPEGREIPDADERRGEREPQQMAMLARGLAGIPKYPVRAIRSLPSALPHLDETPFGNIPGAQTAARLSGRLGQALGRNGNGDTHERPTLKAPKTSFNGRISPHRRFVFSRMDLDEVKKVKNAHGVTVNDVVVAICAGAVRRWLIEHTELPADPLVAQIPVSVRTDEQVGTYGNRIMLMSAPLFTNEPDPHLRLRRTHDALSGMKERHKALPAELLQDANHFIPPAVFARAARTTFALNTSRRGRPTWNLVISNVPGPQFPLYCAGARIEPNYPVSVITDGMGLNITVMSYCGKLDFGIIADREQMPDVGKLLGWLREELDALKPRRPRRSGQNGAKAGAAKKTAKASS